jgi:hypothetical protein
VKITPFGILLAFAVGFISPRARADIFGGDVAVLVQILANAIKQLTEMRNILNTGRDQLQLIRDINRGINDSLKVIETSYPNLAPGIYENWKKSTDVTRGLEEIFGKPGPGIDSQAMGLTDKLAAESVLANTQIREYTARIDKLGEDIKRFSHKVSPGGAAKLTAESLGIMLHVQNEQLRAQGQMLKMQAQTMALDNRQKKLEATEVARAINDLSTSIPSGAVNMTLPRF